MTYSEHEQRLLDQQSGAEMDRQAVRSELLREHRLLMQAENSGPADELAAVRAQLRALEARETALRQTLLHDPEARQGRDYIAEIRETVTQRTDLRELRAMYPEQCAEHTFPAKTTSVVLRRVADQEAV